MTCAVRGRFGISCGRVGRKTRNGSFIDERTVLPSCNPTRSAAAILPPRIETARAESIRARYSRSLRSISMTASCSFNGPRGCFEVTVSANSTAGIELLSDSVRSVAFFPETTDDFTNFLGAAEIGNQNGVRCINDDRVLNPEEHDQSLRSMNQAIVRMKRNPLTLAGVMIAVMWEQPVHGSPASDVAPAEITLESNNFAVRSRGFEHRFVDCDLRHFFVFARDQGFKRRSRVGERAFHGFTDFFEGRRNFRLIAVEQIENGRGLPDENPAVPKRSPIHERTSVVE